MNRAKILSIGLFGSILFVGLWLLWTPVNLTPEIDVRQRALVAVRVADNPHSADLDNVLKLFAGEGESRLRYDQPSAAQQFYMQQRVPAGETSIPIEKYVTAWEQIQAMPQISIETNHASPPGNRVALSVSTESWEALGPGNIGGRTRRLVINPTTPSTMYAAGVAGGIWKTTDAGLNWTVLDDFLPNLAINSLAMDPHDVDTLYAGTGEGYFNGDAVRGNGIYKTTDGGSTWTQLSNTANDSDFHYVNDIVVSHNNPQRVYAATRTGIWRSTDSGTTWTQLLSPGKSAGCLDLVIRTDQNPDTLFASCGSFSGGIIYRSTDGGDSWPTIFTESGMGRTSLAIAPSDEDTVYALAASTDSGSFLNGLEAVYRTINGGNSWSARVRNTDATKLNTSLLTNPVFHFLSECGYGSTAFYNQGWYDNTIAVDPTNADVVWAGGIDLFRSDNGGQDWDLASYWWGGTADPLYVHADQHTIQFHPGYNGTTNTTLFVGNDGGIFRSDNAQNNLFGGFPNLCAPDGLSSTGRVTWTSLNNGYGVTQFYHGMPYPDGTRYFGGTQDNGTNVGNDTDGADNWEEVYGGDGGYVAVDPTNTNVLFVETTRLSLSRSINGGISFATVTTGITENSGNFLFINPFVMDPGNPQILWTGGRYLWRTTDQANNWVRAGTINPGGSFSAHGVAPTDSNYVVSGTSWGYILRSQAALSANSSTTWASTRPVSGYVSWIAFDPTDKNIVYATYSTFGVDHVWKSSDAGVTWTAIDNRGAANGIPDIPVHTIAIDPVDTSRLYVGTDLGIFISTNGGANWAVANDGFANVVTEALIVQQVSTSPDAYQLFAFTHGRGAFRLDLPDHTAVPPPNISATLADSLLVDINGDGNANPGDTIRFTAVITNGGGTASDAVFSGAAATNTSLVVGSVTSTQGTITAGNGAGDPGVSVNIGDLETAVTITFDLIIDDALPENVTYLSAQGSVSGSNFTTVVTDDPDVNGSDDETEITVIVMYSIFLPVTIR